MRSDTKLERQVAELGDLTREELVARWIKSYGCPPPKGIKRALLERSAAWQLQARRLGGLSTMARAALRVDATTASRRVRAKARNGKAGNVQGADATIAPSASRLTAETSGSTSGVIVAPRLMLTPGTRLLREWNGRMHAVDVIEKGFLFDGKRYRSLTSIADRITGSHMSGPVFFGLRKKR